MDHQLPCDGGMGGYGVLNFPKMRRKFHGMYEITNPVTPVDVVGYVRKVDIVNV